MSSFQDLFTSTELDVIVPESGVTFPPGVDHDGWLRGLYTTDRKEAFFDEHLETLFVLRVPQPELLPSGPPPVLLDFLAHVQVLLEASYIAPYDTTTDHAVSSSPFPSARNQPPTPPLPRTSSARKPSQLSLSLSPNPSSSYHPSILPPSTPNPTPQSAAVDQRYLQAEGVVLTSRTWGQDAVGTGVVDKKLDQNQNDRTDKFYLLWSAKEQAWVAIYKTVLDIAFLRLQFDSPLLCLTFSATLRDKPLAFASSSSPLAAYLKSNGGFFDTAFSSSPSKPANPQEDRNHRDDVNILGPPEFNLLAGLYAGPTFAPASALGKRIPATNHNTPVGTPTTVQSRTSSAAGQNIGGDDLNLFSTRLGPISRAKLFALPPVEPETPSSSAMITPTPLPAQSALASATGGHFRSHTISGRSQIVLKKSFRKTLETVSGFKVRMRTVFVPAVLLDEGAETLDENRLDRVLDDANEGHDEDPDRLTSGASERTVVLCVEIETEGNLLFRAANASAFVIEKVDISITGGTGISEDGATATLIGWDTGDAIVNRKTRGTLPKVAEKTKFPLYLGQHEQHNLLYAVTFLRSPQEEAFNGLGSALNPSNITSGVGMGALPSAGAISPNGMVKQAGPDKSLQRAVTITIFGKPCYSEVGYPTPSASKEYHYPTSTFSSRWNCILDLSLSQQIPQRDFIQEYGEDTPLPIINALPEPPSPFPVPVSVVSSASLHSLPASSSFPSIASVVSPRERRSFGFGLDLSSADSKRGSLDYLSASGPATTSMTDKRHTLPNLARTLPSYIQSAGPMERPGSTLGPSRERKDSLGLLSSGPKKDTFATPSPATLKYTSQSVRSPTTYEAPPPPPFKDVNRTATAGVGLSVAIPSVDQQMGLAAPVEGTSIPPMTPAYPAFPSNGNLPPVPLSQGPLIAQGGGLPPNSAGAGYIGPSVEVRRERGVPGYHGMTSVTPQTPGPVVGFGPASRPRQAVFQNEALERGGEGAGRSTDGTGSESIVVSVGILSQQNPLNPKASFESSSPPPMLNITQISSDSGNHELIYPLSTFILDIFVFNRSSWTRRFEISCPDTRSRRKRREMESLSAHRMTGKRRPVDRGERATGIALLPEPGVLPLENRVRIGPLLPSACQSVRMKFLAISPGVHSIDMLTLTDVESGLSMNLRSVMDIVVHEPV